jgi:hypothetical protein
MDELSQLRHYLEQNRVDQALALLDEMDEMSREDKINKIASFMQILLIHLIKRVAEDRTTRSWDVSIQNALAWIVRVNKRRKAGGWYLNDDELRETLDEVFDLALRASSREIEEGIYSPDELASRLDREALLEDALTQIRQEQRA